MSANRSRSNLRRLQLYLPAALILAMVTSANAETFTLSNGELNLIINAETGSIFDVEYAGANYYRRGTPVSDFGFQIGSQTDTFALNPLPLSVLQTGSSGLVTGVYENMAFYRSYSLVDGQNAFEVSTTVVNLGPERVLRQFETFNPHPGYNVGDGFSTFNDVRSFSGPDGDFAAGQASSLGGLSVVMGSTNPATSVASGSPYWINDGAALNSFFTAPFDGEGGFSGGGTHLGLETLLATGQSQTFSYVQAFGQTPEEATSVFARATNSTAAPALSETMTTEAHPVASEIALEIYLGDPNAGGTQLVTVGPTGVQGTVNARLSLDNSGTGYLIVDGADLTLADLVDVPVDLGPLGSVDANLFGVHLEFNFRVPVVENVFSLDDAELFRLAIDGGSGLIDNPVGVIATLLGGDRPRDFDYYPVHAHLADILGLGLSGTTDDGAGGFDPGAEVNIDFTGLTIPLFFLDDGFSFYARVVGNVNVAVPEANSLLLGALAIAVSSNCLYRRRRDRKS